jgi:hypothetical protein
MPIVIDEVVISVEVTGGAAPAGGGPPSSETVAADPASRAGGTEGLVEECVERVLEILARRTER